MFMLAQLLQHMLPVCPNRKPLCTLILMLMIMAAIGMAVMALASPLALEMNPLRMMRP
jgi:hypothetical protein